MIKTDILYQIAEKHNIPVIHLDIPECGSMCIQTEGNACYIGIDSRVAACAVDHRVHMAHELGHCETGAFYNRRASCDIRQKHENTADKWAIAKLVPREELDQAVKDGHTELWDLAECFGVTEDFMRKAVCLYKNGNLAVEAYS